MGKVKGNATEGPAGATNHSVPSEVSSRATSPHTAPSDTTETTPDKFDLILKEIRDTRFTLEQQIGTLTTGLTLLRADHKKLAETVQDRTLQNLDPQVSTHSTQIQHYNDKLLIYKTEWTTPKAAIGVIIYARLACRNAEGSRAADFGRMATRLRSSGRTLPIFLRGTSTSYTNRSTETRNISTPADRQDVKL